MFCRTIRIASLMGPLMRAGGIAVAIALLSPVSQSLADENVQMQAPSVEAVRSGMAVFYSPSMTASRRMAAFVVLVDTFSYLRIFSNLHMNETPDSQATIDQYSDAIKQAYEDVCSAPKQCRSQEILYSETELHEDVGFQCEVLTRFYGLKMADTYIDYKVHASLPIGAIDTEKNRCTVAQFNARAEALEAYGGRGAAVLGLVFFVWLIVRRKPARNPRPQLTNNYGSARYAPLLDEPASEDAAAEGVFLGQSSLPPMPGEMLQPAGAPVFTTPKYHTLIVAQTRTGKGTRVIVPTLLRYKNSVFVIDPKGENAAITARTRRDQLGHAVHIINPWNVHGEVYRKLGFTAATYNPLDAIDRNDPNAVAVAQSLAHAISPPGQGDKDSFWKDAPAALLTGIILWLADQPNEQKTLARVREIIGTPKAEFEKQFLAKMVASSAFHGAIRENVSQFPDMANETYSGIISNLTTTTSSLSDKRIKDATASSSFTMRSLGIMPTTVYVVLPFDFIDTQKIWLRLLMAALTYAYKDFKNHPAPDPKRPGTSALRPPDRCMVIIDELPALRRLATLPRDIATLAGYGIDYTLIVQSLKQLQAEYGDDEAAIVGNCAYKWFCNVNDLESAKYLSECLGDRTVGTTGAAVSSNTNARGESAGESTTFGEMGRRLLRPEEILKLGPDVAIALQPKGSPLYLLPTDYWNLETAFAAWKDRFAKLFWQPPMHYDQNPEYAEEQERQRQQNKSQPPPRGNGKMTRAEAFKVFGLEEDADTAAIRAAYKRLMFRTHPDRGGTDYFAQKLNEAREVLL